MLEVTNLSAGYGTKPVARLASLSMNAGDTALLTGASGAGKTTLLLALAGLAKRFSGDVQINGLDPGALSGAQRDRFRGQNIGFVFQDIHLIAGLSALDNVLLGPFATGAPQDRRRALDLLEALGIAEIAKRPAQALSRGQAQRVAIVRAILNEPKLLLADEPTASLDDAACDEVFGMLVGAAARSGSALVIATHDARLKCRISKTIEAQPVT